MKAVAPEYREAENQLWTALVGKPPVERYLMLEHVGLQIRLLEYGAGPTLLLIHGGPNAASTWVPLLRHLTGYRCLLLDRPGCGLSEAPDKVPRRVRSFMLQVIRDTLNALEIDSASIVASSFGSYTAMTLAVEEPERIARMVHLGCPALIPGFRMPFHFLLRSLPGLRSLYIRLEPPSVEMTMASLTHLGHGTLVDTGRVPDEFAQWYTNLLRYSRTRENDLALFSRVRPWDALSKKELSRLQIPMSFFWGANDTFGGARVARALVDMIPSASLEILEQGGHLPWLDEPERAARHIDGFLNTPSDAK